ncbi:MAG: TetR/AcrR family transcriptional regulator, lmrAB and yxaGH operons repressor [Solirubrobacteraceae bacterium]|nr:TetR/AcrR family transcriptional regulator, lmrAB and yxaGH operons repressor [Solirubrobacteraceae bacterium]
MSYVIFSGMRKGERTKTAMLGATVDLMQRKGIAATGVREVAEHAGAPRGSIAFHFPGGKEQLTTEAVELAGGAFAAALAKLFERSCTADAVDRVAEGMAAGLERSGFATGCPLATTALETAATSAPIAAACDAGFTAWQAPIAKALRRDGFAPAKARDRALLVLSALEGALLLARAKRSADPVRIVARELRPLLEP